MDSSVSVFNLGEKSLSVRAIETFYWRPGIGWRRALLRSIKNIVEDHNLIAISEKPISVALGNVLDESSVRPSSFSKFLAGFWMRVVWGLLLGKLCRLSSKSIQRLRRYPTKEGAKHKEVAWRVAGLQQALKAFSEGA